MSTDPERDLEQTTEDLEERLKTLGEHIDEAEEKAPNATLGDEDGDDVAGESEDSDDDGEDAAQRD